MLSPFAQLNFGLPSDPMKLYIQILRPVLEKGNALASDSFSAICNRAYSPKSGTRIVPKMRWSGLILEGPITREQYHSLDMRSIWMYGQQRAFSFELDESRLLL